MPFGKHRGQDLRDLPEDYLAWLETRDLYEPLRSAVVREAETRRDIDWWARTHGRALAAPPSPKGLNGVPREIVEAGIRAMILKHHPDRGGATETMKQVNLSAEWLRKVTGSAR